MKVTVIAPVADFNGKVGADRFVNGRAEVDSTKLDYYRRHGYTIEPAAAPSENTEAERPKPSAPKADWAKYAEHLGIDTDGMTVEAIKAAVAEHETTDNTDESEEDTSKEA
ncbi:hypothetical protein ACEE90_01445 [Corynebacterium phoceense]